MSSRSRWIVIVLAIIGFGFATSSAWVHYKVLTDASYISPCNINQTFNCEQAYLSRFGRVAGVPVAIGGMFWFGLVALVAFFTPNGSASGKAKAPSGATLFALSVIGLASVLYLGFASFFIVKAACVLCMGTYAAVLGIFITVAASKSLTLGQVPGRLSDEIGQLWKNSTAVIALIALLGGAWYGAMKFPHEGIPAMPAASATTDGLPQSAIDAFAAAWAQLPRVDLGIPADGAKVVIVKFNDFQCPLCGTTNAMYKPILEKFEQSNPGAVKYVLKDWPWNVKCNEALKGAANAPVHPGTCESAAAARMARERGHDAEVTMREWLYSQGMADPARVKAGAESILGVKDFAAEYERMLPGIREDVALGMSLHVNGTPSFFFNGVRVPSDQTMPPSYFELAIKLEMNRK